MGNRRKDPQERDFVLPASDAKGHSVRVQVRVPPTIAQAMQNIFQSRKFPYRDLSQIYRHALQEHLKWLSEMGDIKTHLAQVDAMKDLIFNEEAGMEFKNYFSRLDHVVRNHIAEKSDGEAVRVLLDAHRYIKGMPEGYWRNKYLKKLFHDYDDILKTATVANMGVWSEEEDGC